MKIQSAESFWEDRRKEVSSGFDFSLLWVVDTSLLEDLSDNWDSGVDWV